MTTSKLVILSEQSESKDLYFLKYVLHISTPFVELHTTPFPLKQGRLRIG